MAHIIAEWLEVGVSLFVISVIFFTCDGILTQINTIAVGFGVDAAWLAGNSSMFRLALIIMAVGVIFLGIVRSQREEPTSFYYE